jgi:cation:H+ antiporter
MNLLNVALFVLGFVLLIKGADLLVSGASAIARRFHVSDLAIGLTVVAFGTSTPELFVNVVASLKGNTEIAMGNVLGSNIANILLILGVSALIYPLSVSKGTVWKEIPFSLLAAIVLGIMVNDGLINGSVPSLLSRADGLVLLCFFVIFLYYTHGIAHEIEGMAEQVPGMPYNALRSLLYILLGFAGLALGGKWIVEGAIKMALSLGMHESIVGLTIVAVGTSLPELATSAMAAYRRNVEIAVGNVVGSNIFNIFFVLGVSSAIKPLPFLTSGNLDITMGLVASLMLFLFMFTGKKRSLDRWEGLIFIGSYLVYVTFLVVFFNA